MIHTLMERKENTVCKSIIWYNYEGYFGHFMSLDGKRDAINRKCWIFVVDGGRIWEFVFILYKIENL